MEAPPLLEDLPILVVDDDGAVLRALVRALRESQHFDTAQSGEAALALLEQRAYSVVVADLRMPLMDGVTLLTEVRRRWPDTERVLLTAYADLGAIERSINEAAVRWVMRKPWKLDEVVTVLGQAVAENRMRREHAVLQERVRHRNEELTYLTQQLSEGLRDREASLLHIRRLWDAALQAISDPLIIIDADYRLEGANVAAAKLSGASFEVAEGQLCHRALFGRTSVCPGCPCGIGASEVRDPRTQGVFEARAYELPGGSRLCMYRDVTERRRFHEQAAQLEKMAALGRLAGSIAHELNNPLQGVLSFAQLAERDGIDPQRLQRYHAMIHECAMRCRDIVANLRDFARQAKSDERRDVDLNDICQRAMQMFTHVRDRRLAFTPSVGRPTRRGNANQLLQVVVNLIQNAIDATPVGGVVAVSTLRRDDGLVIVVEDEGEGVPSADRERIFEPFYTTKPEGVGTGLGLAISHSIMVDHGGTLCVGDAACGGARFEMRLPSLNEPPPDAPHGKEL